MRKANIWFCRNGCACCSLGDELLVNISDLLELATGDSQHADGSVRTLRISLQQKTLKIGHDMSDKYVAQDRPFSQIVVELLLGCRKVQTPCQLSFSGCRGKFRLGLKDLATLPL